MRCIGLTVKPKDDFLCKFCQSLQQMECAKCYKHVLSVEDLRQ